MIAAMTRDEVIEKIKHYYDRGYYTADDIQRLFTYGIIIPTEYDRIMGNLIEESPAPTEPDPPVE